MEYVFPSAPGWPLLNVLQSEHLGPPGRLSASSGAEPGFSGLIADEADCWGTPLEHVLDLATRFG